VLRHFVKALANHTDTVGHKDSQVLDPGGEIIAASRRHEEVFIMAEIDPKKTSDTALDMNKSAWRFREFHRHVIEAMKAGGVR
jgi:hypothetical protein